VTAESRKHRAGAEGETDASAPTLAGHKLDPNTPIETTEQLRIAIDQGHAGSKVDATDPAAAPLGTDDEAGGTPNTTPQVRAAAAHEGKSWTLAYLASLLPCVTTEAAFKGCSSDTTKKKLSECEQQRRSRQRARKLSEREQQRRSRQRALSIIEFCKRYGLCRTKAYDELKSGRLRARKLGKRTLISTDDAENWFEQLPEMGARND